MSPEEKIALIDKIYEVTDQGVYGFFKDHRFLSNFHECKIIYSGLVYLNTEAAYQSAKTNSAVMRQMFTTMRAVDARRAGQKLELRSDWHAIRKPVMERITLIKFMSHPELKDALLATGDKYLEETNYWQDKFWGRDIEHNGENNLGKILIEVRSHLKRNIYGNAKT